MPLRAIIALGLVQGSLAGLNTLGLVLLWRTTRVVNLAQPAMGMVGGVLTGLLVASAGWSFWWAAPIGIAFGALMGLGAERLVLVRLQDVPRAVLLVATVGLAQLFAAMHTALPFIFGGPMPSYTVQLGITMDIFPVRLLGPHILALICLPLALVGMHVFLHRTRLGLAACALGQDAERARTLGVPAGPVRSVVWALAGALSAVSGILVIPVRGFGLEGGIGTTLLLLALAPAVVAGLRSLHGAVAAALVLGIAYEAWLSLVDRAGIADLLLAGAIILAVALQRQRLGRAQAAARASSWEAATSPRPLPWAVASHGRVRAAGSALTLVAVACAAAAPMFLSPRQEVLYATSTALALAALAVAAAWMFAGEISLGHWGLAGLGAAVAAVTPGPWVMRAVVAGVAMAVGGMALAVVSRHQSSLSFAVLTLAAAMAAPVAILAVGGGTVTARPGIVGATGGAIAVLAAVALASLRASSVGTQMVAARDEPQRAPWLGVDPMIARVVGLTVAGGLAGVAGVLYLAAVPAGIAPGAFDSERSLDLLAMAVVGGLGSPVGALLGAAALQAARFALPGPWAMLASGVGILVVVMVLPAGLGRIVEWVRDRGVAILVGSGAAAETEPPTPKRSTDPPVPVAGTTR